jgi:hypothetical protein
MEYVDAAVDAPGLDRRFDVSAFQLIGNVRLLAGVVGLAAFFGAHLLLALDCVVEIGRAARKVHLSTGAR